MPINQMVKQNRNPNLKEKEPYQLPSTRYLHLKLSNSNSNRTHRAIGDDKIGSEIRERDCVGGWPQATATNLALPLVPKHIDISDGEIESEIALAWPRILDVLPQCCPLRYFSSLLLSLFLYLILHLCCALRLRAALSLCFSLN